jgi:hypothetical protein
MVCLYPITAAAGIAATLATRSIFTSVLPADAGDVPFALGIVVGAVVIGIVFRLEVRLAGSTGYRVVRHVVRMILLAIWAIPIIQLTLGAAAPTTSTAYIFFVISNPSGMVQFLANPLMLGIWIAVVVGLHFLIWKADGVRRFWHRRLVWIGLK